MMKFLERWFLGLFGSVDSVALGFFTKIGPYITAAIPALLAGYGISQYFDTGFGMTLGFVVGIGMEAAGIKIIHTAIEYSDKHPGKKDTRFVLLVMASFLFVALVSGTIYTSDKALPHMVRVIGAISPTLAAMAYFALGVEKSLEREQRTKEVDGASTKRKEGMVLDFEQEKLKLELDAERDRIKAQSLADALKIKSEAQAHQAALAQEAHDKQSSLDHERELERLALAQKHEKAMKKIESSPKSSGDAASTTSNPVRGKPFKKYDEFAAALEQSEDLQEVSRKMSLTMTTIRGYKRKFDSFHADDAPDVTSSSLNNNDENLQESNALEHVSLNGHS